MTAQRKVLAHTAEIQPRITLSAKDYKNLALLVRTAANKVPDVASLLSDELERAQVLADCPSGQSVCMGNAVEFRDDTTGQVQTVTLVYPGDADISMGRISVLTPVGA